MANVLAAPKDVEVWFLSEPMDATVNMLIDKHQEFRFFQALAENETHYKCIPMGDGCFHPQTGYVDKRPTIMEKKVEERETVLKTFNALETNLVDCDKNNYFDIYCGQAQKIDNPKKVNLEIWIDTSASLKRIDYNKDVDFCNRRSFITSVFEKCSREKVAVYIYNAQSIKEIGDLSSLCLNNGTNDEGRLIEWIKNSSAAKLIIITDVDEYRSETSDYLDSIGAKIIGGGVTKFFSKELMSKAQELSSICKK